MVPRKSYYGARVRRRGVCPNPNCGRDVALLSDGRVAMRHKTPDGSRCDAHGQPAADGEPVPPAGMGTCSLCSARVAVMVNGHPRPHKVRRIRRGRAGLPETYLAEDCDGYLHPVEPEEG